MLEHDTQRLSSAAQQRGALFAYANRMTLCCVRWNDEMDSPCQYVNGIKVPNILSINGIKESIE